MGAGDWVTGGLRRAVTGVVAALPGQGAHPEPDAGAEPELFEPAAAEPVDAERAPTEPDIASPPDPMVSRSGPAPARHASSRPAARARRSKPGVGATAPDSTVPPTASWTDEELAVFRSALDADIARLREELDMGEADLAGLIADSGEGAGDDQADAGSKTFEREHEMSVNANIRDMLDQALRALGRLEHGTYGLCESCGRPIRMGRLKAFPRATLCIECKQAEERR